MKVVFLEPECFDPAREGDLVPAARLDEAEEDEVVLVDDGGEQLQGDLARHRQLLQAPVQRLDSEGGEHCDLQTVKY